MPYTFDAHSFEYLLGDAKRLLARAADHERRLAWLISALEGDGRAVIASAAGISLPLSGSRGVVPPSFPPAMPASGIPAEFLGILRGLCISAREQRQLCQTVLGRLGGDFRLSVSPVAPPAPVLVVDDSADNCELIAGVLEAAGFTAVTAANGLDGVLAAHCLRPSVVLMDVTMPVLDGIEATRLLKSSAATRNLNVIAHTAKPDFRDAPLTRLFADVLPKPSPPDAIVASVQRYAAPS